MTTADEHIITDLGMFGELEELVLLANWSMGKHREDIAEIDSLLFSRKKLYKAVCEGLNPSEIMRAGALEGSSITELSGIGTASFIKPYYVDGVETPLYTEARTRALIKQIGTYTDKIRNNNNADTNELLEKIRRTEAAISGEDFKPLHTNYGARFIEELEQIRNESNPRYGSGFKFLDRCTNGLHRGELTIIGARPRIGKSAIALQIAYNVSIVQGYKVLFLPLEMTVNQCLSRILLHVGYVEPDYEKTSTAEDKEQISNYLDSLEENLKFCTALNRIEDIERLIKAEKPYLVVIDQLSQLKPIGKAKDLREQYVANTRALKRIALEQNVAIIAISQVNRVSKEKPTLESLAESDSIGQDADNVLLLSADEEELKKDNRLTTLYIVKQRNGKSDLSIPLMYTGDRFTFYPVDTKAD